MKLTCLAALTLLALPVAAHAQSQDQEHFSIGDQISGTLAGVPTTPRYQKPMFTGGIDPTPAASAGAPVPANILHNPPAYQTGEASIPEARHLDAKGSAADDHRAARKHHRAHHAAWKRHSFR